jgi:hypothetical protein
MYTEKEAKKKWCPMAKETAFGVGSFNKTSDGKPVTSCNCIASECMMWRWRETVLTQGTTIPMPQGNPSGYCGLAGKL